jgi:hypothetical protein
MGGRFAMTTLELIRILLRRWYVMVIGAALSVAVLYFATGHTGVYWAQYNIVLLPPEAPSANYLNDPRYGLEPLVGVVASDLNGTNRPLSTASSDATLVGIGVDRGVQVRVPNQGSQWQPVFGAHHLDLQIVDSSPEEVLKRVEEVN